MSQAGLSECQHLPLLNNCKKCSIYLHQDNKACKSQHFDSILYCSSQKYLKNIRKTKANLMPTTTISEEIIKMMHQLSVKYNLSIETQVLALYIMARMSNRFGAQFKDQQLLACSSLMVSCKAIQLDRNIPLFFYLSQNCQEQMEDEAYEEIERQIMKEFNFNFQISTFVTFVNFYLVNGIAFESDLLEAEEILQLENTLLGKCRKMLQTSKFLMYSPEKLALSLVKESRISYNLSPWNKQLERMTGFEAAAIAITDHEHALAPINYLIFRKKNANMKIASKLTHQSPKKSSSIKFQRKNNSCSKARVFKKENNKLLMAKLGESKQLNLPTFEANKEKRINIFMISMPKYVNMNNQHGNENEKNPSKLATLRKTLSREKLKPLLIRR